MTPISPSTFAVYIFPIPAMELISTSQSVTLFHRRQAGAEEETVATLEPRSEHIFSIAQLLDSEHHFVRDGGNEYPIEQAIDGLIMQQVISSANDLGINLPDHLVHDSAAGQAGGAASAGRQQVTRAQITSGASDGERGSGQPFPFVPVPPSRPTPPQPSPDAQHQAPTPRAPASRTASPSAGKKEGRGASDNK